MSNANTAHLLEAADKAYKPDVYSLTEDVPAGVRGDTLADFVFLEIREVTQGALTFEEAKELGIGSMETAIRQLADVKDALEHAVAPQAAE